MLNETLQKVLNFKSNMRPKASAAQPVKQHQDALLDAALKESFPASDVPAISFTDKPKEAQPKEA